MATIIPSIEKAKQSRQPPTPGEIYLLEYLRDNFDADSEVYFQPCFNGDRPDIIIINKNLGVIVIEVKDWKLSNYKIDTNNQWSLKSNGARIKSPFAQVFSYKKNIFEIHVNGLLEKYLKNDNFFNLVKVYVYFHNATLQTIKEFYSSSISPLSDKIKKNGIAFNAQEKTFDSYEKERIHLASKKNKLTRDSSTLSLTKENLEKISFSSNKKNILFDDNIYQEFIRLLQPPYHYATEGKDLSYTKLQSRLCESISGAKVKICGIAGSGKTTVLAKRAVGAHKRHGEKVLILTYNLTLKMYIRGKINEVRENFSWGSFEITNYHKFTTFALNNAGIKIEFPEDKRNADAILETNYYSNLSIFLDCDIQNKYHTILVDEIQDYRPEWIKIIRDNFLEENGEMVLFGDEKQNIYSRSIDTDRRSKLVEGFGRWEKLTKSFRYKEDSHILKLADAFQNSFLSDSYEVDKDESYQPSLSMIGINAYAHYSERSPELIAKTIITLAKSEKIHPNDISIISSQEGLIQKLDFAIRNGELHKERTITTFESMETTKHEKFSKSARKISAAKKIGFNLNSGVMKLSTTHSFKGYESPCIFLLVNENDSPEMIYTGLTRAKENIIVFLPKDSKYSPFFESNLDHIERFLIDESSEAIPTLTLAN